MSRPAKLARMDWPLLVNALLLCGVGLLNVYSGTRIHGVAVSGLFTKQLIWIALGVIVFFVAYYLSDGTIEEVSGGFFLAVLGLLVVVLVAGKIRGGAQRWISLGAFNFQPSEFAKIAVILVMARYFSGKYQYGGIRLKDTLPAIGIVLVPFLLVALGVAFAAIFGKVQPMVFGETNARRLPHPPALVPVFVHLAIVLLLGLYIPPYLVDWYRQAARLIG